MGAPRSAPESHVHAAEPIAGDQVRRRTDAQIVAEANGLARTFYKLHGCEVREGYRFDEAVHPQEQSMWLMAIAAFAELRDTDVEDALSNLEDE
jgi:hypothetical protein